MRQPTRSPVSDMTMTPMPEWTRLDMLRATTTDDRLIGRARNRSTMPLSRSLVSPIATMNEANAMVCAMIPGSNHSR